MLASPSSNAVLALSLQLSSAADDDVVPGVFICDIQDGMMEELTVDGLHPTASGQEILANNFANFVRERCEKLGDF
jgi:lysophospholipase L1-like esterase